MKKEFTLNGKNIVDLNSFYDEIQRALCPELKEFGRNFNALDDVLSGGFGSFEYGEDIKLHWINSAESREALGYEETERYYKDLALTAHESNLDEIQKFEHEAKDKTGDTVFDTIIELIRDHQNIELVLE